MSDTPSVPTFQLEPAPGAKAATQLGIWSLLTNVLCGCFPVSIGLGIGAILKHGKAKRLAEAEPERYQRPTNTGLVTGIIGICWTLFALFYIGIVSAIAIPALLGQREQARARAVQALVSTVKAEALRAADQVGERDGGKVDPQAVVQVLLAEPALHPPTAVNPYAPGEGPFVAADEPAKDGQIALRGAYAEVDGLPDRPVLQIRAQVRRGGQAQVTTTLVPLD